tara:strand:- start:96 stop:551 length:456 start_codon:yes stop_codon:yes gene_type:complete
MKIGFIGLGNVGGKLAGSLLRNGFELHVRDLDQDTAKPLLDQGAIWWNSNGSMTREVDVVITCLPSPEASAKVMEEADGILENMRPGMIWAEMSTTDEKEVKRLGKRVSEKGVSRWTVLYPEDVIGRRQETSQSSSVLNGVLLKGPCLCFR